jgi:hypothetical protein
MTRLPTAIPYRPDYSAATNQPSKSFWRGVTANAIGTIKNESPEAIVERAWRGDDAAKIIARAVLQQQGQTMNVSVPGVKDL